MIMDKQFQPVIVFSFSKRECEAYALQLQKLDFNGEEEKEMVDTIFNNAIDGLSDDDKKLPQVESILPLLRKGIGIHHSGLLPILKEVIEILFQEGLIKVCVCVCIWANACVPCPFLTEPTNIAGQGMCVCARVCTMFGVFTVFGSFLSRRIVVCALRAAHNRVVCSRFL